jgi:ABC-2 type transport system permease protein
VSPLALVGHQFRYDLLGFFRNGQSRFFTLALPVLFLVIFATVFGNEDVRILGSGVVKQTTYYVPGIVALGVISAGMVNLVISVVIQRESGVLKRRRATPVPAWVLIAGRALTATVVSALIAAILIAVGALAYGVELPLRHVPAVVLAVVVGALSFCCIGYALVSVVGSEDAAQPIIQAVTLPLYFISGVFFPEDQIPKALLSIADLFPVRHLQQALLAAFDPARGDSAIELGHLGIIALWGVAALAFAVRRFSWTPRGE